MRGQYFSILHSSLRCLNRGVAVKNVRAVQYNHTRSVLGCERTSGLAFNFHTSSILTYPKDDPVEKEEVVTAAKTEEASKIETPLKSAAEKRHDPLKLNEKYQVKPTTAKKVKRKRMKKTKRTKKSKKQDDAAASAQESFVKKVAKKTYSDAVKEQKSVELDLLSQLLMVDGNSDKLQQSTTKKKESVTAAKTEEAREIETLLKSVTEKHDAAENNEKYKVGLTTARKVKKKPTKMSKKQDGAAAPAPETFVKEVSKEMFPDAVEEQKNVELDLLSQLLMVDGKGDKLQDSTTKSLFNNVSPKKDKAQYQRKYKSGDRLKYFNLTQSTIEASKEMKRPQDKSLWTATDWYNSMQEDIDQRAFDVPYPANAYQEQIMWTEEGKLWTFPINNEQGVDEEEMNTPFYKHVFLDSHINDWCPSTGAIRDFMTSLVTALSMNPHLSVREKHEHLDWFRSYFEEKSDMMQALGLAEDRSAAAASSKA